MGNGIDEAVVLLTAPQLTHQKNRVYHHAGNDQREKDNSKKQQHALAPVENDPADVEGNRQRHQANAQAKKKNDRSAAARYAHSVLALILPRRQPRLYRERGAESHESQQKPAAFLAPSPVLAVFRVRSSYHRRIWVGL